MCFVHLFLATVSWAVAQCKWRQYELDFLGAKGLEPTPPPSKPGWCRATFISSGCMLRSKLSRMFSDLPWLLVSSSAKSRKADAANGHRGTVPALEGATIPKARSQTQQREAGRGNRDVSQRSATPSTAESDSRQATGILHLVGHAECSKACKADRPTEGGGMPLMLSLRHCQTARPNLVRSHCQQLCS